MSFGGVLVHSLELDAEAKRVCGTGAQTGLFCSVMSPSAVLELSRRLYIPMSSLVLVMKAASALTILRVGVVICLAEDCNRPSCSEPDLSILQLRRSMDMATDCDYFRSSNQRSMKL